MGNVIICATNEIGVDGIPEEIRILPLGHVHSQKGEFIVDEESFKMIQKEFTDRKLDKVIDYEHQTLSNVQAPAGGWIKSFGKTEDAIVAKVEWTPKAMEYLQNKEYRYLSPVIVVRPSDQKVRAIHSVALTNTPAIDGMFAIANSLDIENDDDVNETGGSKMELLELIKLLGMEENATEDQVKKALEALATAKGKEAEAGKEAGKTEDKDGEKPELVANSTILNLLNLSEGAKTEEVAATILSLKSGTANVEMMALKQRLDKKEAEESVALAKSSGKISAAQTEWALAYALKDPVGFANFAKIAPQTVPIGKLDIADAPAATVITNEDMKVLKNLGLSKEDIKKYINKEGTE